MEGRLARERALARFAEEQGEIRAVLHRLGDAVRGSTVSAGRVARVLGCLSSLRDLRAHHSGEEGRLLPILRQSGLASTSALLEREHRELAALESSCRGIAHDVLFGTAPQRGAWSHLRGSAESLLRREEEHLHHESSLLYPRVVDAATPSEWEHLGSSAVRPRGSPPGVS